MSKQRREKISFVAERKVTKPVKVDFYTKRGERVSFQGHKQVTKPVRVEFYVKKSKKG